MKNTALYRISLFWFLLLIFGLVGCNNNKQHETKKTTLTKQLKQKKAIKSQPKKRAHTKKVVRLTNDNVKKELLEYGAKNKETIVLMKTPKGNIKIKLYKNTPLHRANFIRLIKNNFYKETMFYRVVNDFMIQGGDNDDWARQTIKNRMGDYTIPAEFNTQNIHKKGALSMAREYDNNPDKRSVSFEFFIVQGTKYTEGELLGAEQEYGMKITPKHKEIYKIVGGTPHLDGKHTVFGQVIEGLEVIDSIASVKVDEGNWPIQDITIEFKILQ